jgi:hypothetical protein
MCLCQPIAKCAPVFAPEALNERYRIQSKRQRAKLPLIALLPSSGPLTVGHALREPALRQQRPFLEVAFRLYRTFACKSWAVRIGRGDGPQRSLNHSSRPCANPRPDERGPLAETTELSCGHTCRMRPVRARRPSPMLPSLPLCAQVGPAPPPASGRSSESRETTGSVVSRLRSKPRIRCRNIVRTQRATNVLPDTDRGDRA